MWPVFSRKIPLNSRGSDLSPDLTSWLAAQPIEAIHIVGRRGASDAKFTQHELAELGTLQRAGPLVVQPAELLGDGAVVETFAQFCCERSAQQAPGCYSFSIST